MNFLALNDDAKFIISKHLQSDHKINKIFMTDPCVYVCVCTCMCVCVCVCLFQVGPSVLLHVGGFNKERGVRALDQRLR